MSCDVAVPLGDVTAVRGNAATLSDAELDVFRQRTDPVLDELLGTLPPQEVGQMLGKLFKSDTIPLEDERFARLCAQLPAVPIADPAAIAEAVVVDDGSIVFVGSKADALKRKGDGTVVKDLAGKTLMPGFIDPHVHRRTP